MGDWRHRLWGGAYDPHPPWWAATRLPNSSLFMGITAALIGVCFLVIDLANGYGWALPLWVSLGVLAGAAYFIIAAFAHDRHLRRTNRGEWL